MQVSDLLMQRFKAIEHSLADGSWRLAEHSEGGPDMRPTLASAEEQTSAAKAAFYRAKLDEAKKKRSSDGRRGEGRSGWIFDFRR